MKTDEFFRNLNLQKWRNILVIDVKPDVGEIKFSRFGYPGDVVAFGFCRDPFCFGDLLRERPLELGDNNDRPF